MAAAYLAAPAAKPPTCKGTHASPLGDGKHMASCPSHPAGGQPTTRQVCDASGNLPGDLKRSVLTEINRRQSI